MLVMNGVEQTTGTVHVYRFQSSGSDLTASNYNKTGWRYNPSSQTNVGDANVAWYFPDTSSASGKPYSAVHYIFCAPISNAYTLITTNAGSSNTRNYQKGGGVYKSEVAVDGISILAFNTTPGDGVFSAGKFSLFGLVD